MNKNHILLINSLDEKLVVTLGGSDPVERGECYCQYDSEKESVTLNEHIFLETKYPLFEMWHDGNLAGLLNLEHYTGEEDGVVMLELLGVFLLEEFRGRGMSKVLINASVDYLTHTYGLCDVPKGESRVVYFSADLESESGERFVEDFLEDLATVSDSSSIRIDASYGY